ncbi:hypothetical protein [Spiroplasma poulsonii]|nr:hypothetical protein [Spiroplasma poulsonii]
MAKLNTFLEKNGIKELSSFSNTKEFKKMNKQRYDTQYFLF